MLSFNIEKVTMHGSIQLRKQKHDLLLQKLFEKKKREDNEDK